MTALTWLHLSDWHQRGPDFDRKVVREALIEDIKWRAEGIDPALAQVDFVCFSGDLAFSARPDQYQAARAQLLDPVLDAVGLDPQRLFIVPGNHDLDRAHVAEMLPAALQQPFDSHDQVERWLVDDAKRRRLLEPFEAFRTFVADYTGLEDADYASVRRLFIGDKQVALLGLNSALMCARHKDQQGWIDDTRRLIVGEPQLHDRLAEIADADLRIAVMHHPFDWLAPFDRDRIEERLRRACHFVLLGHEHQPRVDVVSSTAGDCVIVPAGAGFDRRVAEDPRYTNAYSWVRLDLAAGTGSVHLRRWSDRRNAWIADTDTHDQGTYRLQRLPKGLGAATASTATTAPAQPVQAPSPSREQLALRGYLEALERNNADLEPGGIKQTKVRVVLPLDEVYVGLQADLDRPDVDRRVMQDELDEIRAGLEREDDPAERERQYRVWAMQARVLERALDVAAPARASPTSSSATAGSWCWATPAPARPRWCAI
jgi:3',5'-cyclic AMP phosphodiesterase CpdA